MRDLTPAMEAELAGKSIEPVFMSEMMFSSGTIGMWSGYGTLTWGVKEFLGGGNFTGISPVEETQDLQAKGLVATLNGVPSNLIALALLERVRGRPFRLYLGINTTRRYVATEDEPGRLVLEDGSGYVILENQLLDSPYRLFSGLMDFIEMKDTGSTADIMLSVESNLIIGQRAKISRYTSEDQKKKYPDDLGLDFINQLQDKEVVW